MSEVGRLYGTAESGGPRPLEAPASAAADASTGRQPVAASGKTPPRGVAGTDAAGVAETVTRLNAYVQSISRELQFSIDPATGYQVVKVLDASSGEIIRQMPSDQLLALAELLLAEDELPRKGLLMEGVV